MSDKGQVVRYSKGKTIFQVITNEGTVLKYRDNKIQWQHVLASDVIFKQFAKGLRASDKDIQEAFPNMTKEAVLRLIVEKGDLQVSAGERKEALDHKIAEIVTYICKNYVDPSNKLPHPRVRVEQALNNSKLRVDADAGAAKQAQELVQMLQGTLSFAKAEREAELRVPSAYSGAASGIVHSRTDVKSQRFDADGVTWEVGIPPADFDDFVQALNKVTKGDYSLRLAEAPPAAVPVAKGRKPRKK
jgi:ribosome maturation protein SDO1